MQVEVERPTGVEFATDLSLKYVYCMEVHPDAPPRSLHALTFYLHPSKIGPVIILRAETDTLRAETNATGN